MTPAQVCDLFGRNNLPLDEHRAGLLLHYERLLLEWNEKINLVSRRDTPNVFLKQILGSVSFLFGYQLAGGTSLLDVGTGGGLPGIPVAIIHPDVRVTLVDSIRKKIGAVTDIIGKLGVPNVRALCARVEELDPGTVGRFDYVVARGVSSASEIVGWCRQLLDGSGASRGTAQAKDTGPRKQIRPGSYILIKGGDLAAELEDLSMTAGSASVAVRSLTVEGAEEHFTDKKVIIITP